MLFPFFPDDALCMLAGLTNIPLGRFVVIMALSRPWGLIVAALMGSGSISLPIWAWAVIGVAGLFIFYFAMKYSAKDRGGAASLCAQNRPPKDKDRQKVTAFCGRKSEYASRKTDVPQQIRRPTPHDVRTL